jgi:hypothetical protein
LALIFPDFFLPLGSQHVDWPSIQFSLLFSSDLFARPRFLFRPCSILDDLLQLFLGFGDTGDRRSFFLEDSAFVGFFFGSVGRSVQLVHSGAGQAAGSSIQFPHNALLDPIRTPLVSILAHNYGFDFTDSAKILVFYRFGKDSCRWEVVVSD